jgi:molecular chaperone Hsp33
MALEESNLPPAGGDFVRPFLLEIPGFLGRLVRLGPTVDAILTRHDYPEEVALLLGEFLALAGTLSSLLKFEGTFTVQTKGDGPVGMMVADVVAGGALRGYAEIDRERLEAEVAACAPDRPSSARLLGGGYMAFTVDPGGDSERYQGIVESAGETLADCVHHYFRQSEQLKTAIKLSAGRVDGQWHAAGLLVQQLPVDENAWLPGAAEPEEPAVLGSADEDDWRRVQAFMASCRDDELLDPAVAPDDLLYRLFHEERVRVYRTRPLSMGCRCSRARIETILRSLPRGEVAEMKVEGEVVMTCQFCNVDFRFDDAALEDVYAPAAAGGAT